MRKFLYVFLLTMVVAPLKAIDTLQESQMQQVWCGNDTVIKKPIVPKREHDVPDHRNDDGDVVLDSSVNSFDNIKTTPQKKVCFRIQIFTGGNSRIDRLNAIKMGQKCVEAFPELRMFTHFISPRWICRVGDFRTSAAAQAYAKEIRKKGVSRETRVVRCVIVSKKK